MTHRDSSGRTLADYPRPSVAVDTAVLTVEDGRLLVVLTGAGDALRLPGTFLHEGEVLAEAVQRSLVHKTGIEGLDPQQLHVFDALGRDDRGWVLSVAHVAVVPAEMLADRSRFRLVPTDQAVGLRWDHDTIVRLAVDWLRAKFLDVPDPAGLLREPFSLRDLQQLHEAVAGRTLMKDAFRRSMEPRLVQAQGTTRGAVGKPARLWRRKRQNDRTVPTQR